MNCAPPPPFLIPNSPAPHLSFSLPSSLPFNFLLLPEYEFSLSYYHLVLLQHKKFLPVGKLTGIYGERVNYYQENPR